MVRVSQDLVTNLSQNLEPKSVYEAGSFKGVWDLAQTKYPADNIAHFFYLIMYMMAFYGLLHLVLHGAFMGCNSRYQKLKKPKQGEYRSNIVSPIHGLSCVYASVLTMFYVCPDDQTVFNNEVCFNTPRYLHIWALVNTCGYFITDTIIIVVVIRQFTTYDKQMIGHHVIAFFTFVGTLAFMNFTVVFGVMLLFVEVSSAYIALRWLLYTHKLNRTIWNTVNAVVIFVTFLFGRLVFQLGILFGYGYPSLIGMIQDESLPWYKVILCISMFIALTFSALMNCFWMYLIVAQIKRIMNRPPGEIDEDVSQSEEGGGDPSNAGDERTSLLDSSRQPPTPMDMDDGLDTDDERDTLHISST